MFEADADLAGALGYESCSYEYLLKHVCLKSTCTWGGWRGVMREVWWYMNDLERRKGAKKHTSPD